MKKQIISLPHSRQLYGDIQVYGNASFIILLSVRIRVFQNQWDDIGSHCATHEFRDDRVSPHSRVRGLFDAVTEIEVGHGRIVKDCRQ